MAFRNAVAREAPALMVVGGSGAGKSALITRLALVQRALPFLEIAADAGAPALAGAIGAAGAADGSALLVVVDAVQPLPDSTREVLGWAATQPALATIVAVNKMDRVGYEFEIFKRASAAINAAAGRARWPIVPVSARFGDNLTAGRDTIDWYRGATLAQLLEARVFETAALAA